MHDVKYKKVHQLHPDSPTLARSNDKLSMLYLLKPILNIRYYEIQSTHYTSSLISLFNE